MWSTGNSLLLAFLLFIGSGWDATAAPKICVDATTCTFESVVEGDSVQCVFLLGNCGDADLVIQSVRAGCGCTTTMMTNKTIAPGAVAPLTATFHTAGYGGYTVSKSITVETNDPETPNVVLTLSGSVAREAMCTTPAADVVSGFTVLIDLRTPEEFAAGHLLGAVNIPLEELTQWIGLFPRRVRVVLYDQDGSGIDAALRQLTAQGISEGCGLEGGLDEWVATYGTSLIVTFKLMPATP